jgi:hypothetical protein
MLPQVSVCGWKQLKLAQVFSQNIRYCRLLCVVCEKWIKWLHNWENVSVRPSSFAVSVHSDKLSCEMTVLQLPGDFNFCVCRRSATFSLPSVEIELHYSFFLIFFKKLVYFIGSWAGSFSLLQRVQNGSGAHPASYPVGTGGTFPGGKAAGVWSWPLP